MRRREGPRGRETAAARSNVRRTWHGYGTISRGEKSDFGVFLHDTSRIAAELTAASLPVLLVVMDYPTTGWFDAKATGMAALVAAVLAGTLVRGGWVRPLGTDALGWVTLSPVLLLARVPYFCVALAVATFGGLALGEAVLVPLGLGWTVTVLVGLAWAVTVAVLATLAFPRVAEEVAVRAG